MNGNRKKDFENIAICWFVILVITSATTYFAITGELMVQTGIVCVVLIISLVLIGIWGVVAYRNLYLEKAYQSGFKERQKTRMRNRKYSEKVSGRAIYKICKSYIWDAIFAKAFIVGIMFGALVFASKVFGLPALSGKVNIMQYLVVSLVVSLGSGGVYFVYAVFSDDSIKRLRIVIEESGYDVERIADDFESGIKYEVFEGFLHIGPNYVMLCHKNMSFVEQIREIEKVTKEKKCEEYFDPMGQKLELVVCFVALYTDRRKVRVKCLSEAIADSIVEDFLLHGIYDKNEYE